MSKRPTEIDPETKAIGERLVSARRAKGMKQKALSRASGVENVYRHEKGLTRPGIDSAIKYSRALDVTPEWIMHGGPGGPGGSESATVATPAARLVTRTKAGDTTDVPLVVAKLLASGCLGANVPNDDEIAYLSRQARAEPGRSMDDLELDLLSRRATQSREQSDVDLYNAAFNRQSEERKERLVRLPGEQKTTPPQPDSVRKARARKRTR